MADVKLIDLKPRHLADRHLGITWADDPPRSYYEIAFLCPKCRKHELSVAFWSGPQSDAVEVGKRSNGTPNVKRLWHREGTQGFLDLTLTPSINREGKGDKCGGWHGHIIGGKVQ